MRFSLFTVFSFFSLLILGSYGLLCSTNLSTSDTISYQIHSWDDLREWDQALRKGAVWFKIDPHWMNSSFCANQIRAPTDVSKGCFLLSHDLPIELRNDYNTTQDVIQLLSSTAMRKYVTRQTTLTIALCFKVDLFDPCDGSEAAYNWTLLVNDLFTEYSTFIQTTGFNIEFVLDGASTPGGGRKCLQDLWRPWNATWIITTDAHVAFITDKPINGSDRFQIMNTPINTPFRNDMHLRVEGSKGWGKFANSRYPFLNWEPSNQWQILRVADYYLETALLHSPGFKFAINMDPIQFEIFSGSRSNRAWNICLQPGIHPLITLLPSDVSKQPTFLLIYQHKLSEQYEYSILQVSGVLETIEQSPSKQIVFSSTTTPTKLSSISVNQTNSLILLWFENGDYQFFLFDNSKELLISQCSGSWISEHGFVYYSSGVLSKSESGSVIVTVTSSVEYCQISMSFLMFDLEICSLQSLNSELCLSESTVSINSVDASVIRIRDKQTAVSLCDHQFDFAGVLSFADSLYKIHWQMFCFNSTGKVTFLGKHSMDTLDVGDSSRVSLEYQNNTLMIMEVHERGYCWNSHTANTRSAPALCDTTPFPMSHILSYNYGSWHGWREHVTQSIPMNPCDSTILHGVYDSGSHPTISLYDYQNNLGIIEIHEGLSTIKSPDVFHCGAAIATDKMILDSWDLDTVSKIP